MAPMPSWILKAPRVVLIVVFPIINFILYLILSLGCITDSLSGISPVVAMSNELVNVGGSQIRVDLRVGFWGLCFGPAPVNCTSSVAVFQTKREAEIAREIPVDRGGGNFALAGLALGLQSSFVVLSGIPVLLLLFASLVANMVQIYFNANGMGDRHAQAALWARSLDWAAAAGVATGFSAYQSVVAAASRLIRTVSGTPLTVTAGTTASNLFAAVVGTTVAGALINTFLTAGDAAFDAYVAAKKREGAVKEVRAGTGNGDGSARLSFRRRPAYEAFP
ncbi:hypothetical protein MFIFM68171_11021 [Madurella fahalii]|uniref:Uncharacterized protein n=1 Tax=Madurella fahalii TaxID=1157608 RepID=A0ABQ0GST6_9PEZI